MLAALRLEQILDRSQHVDRRLDVARADGGLGVGQFAYERGCDPRVVDATRTQEIPYDICYVGSICTYCDGYTS